MTFDAQKKCGNLWYAIMLAMFDFSAILSCIDVISSSVDMLIEWMMYDYAKNFIKLCKLF